MTIDEIKLQMIANKNEILGEFYNITISKKAWHAIMKALEMQKYIAEKRTGYSDKDEELYYGEKDIWYILGDCMIDEAKGEEK